MSMELNQKTELSEEREKQILENQGLVFYMLYLLGINKSSKNYEDICSSGMIGLVKAVNNFDETKGIAFSTYALTCIQNEIFMYFRKDKKWEKNVSLEEPIASNDERDSLSLKDTIGDSKSDFVQEISNKEDAIKVIHIVLNYLEGRKRIVMLYHIGNLKQTKIAKLFNINQSRISIIERKAVLSIREAIDNQEQYREIFSVDLVNEEYKISFLLENVGQSKESFTKLLKRITSIENPVDFKVNCDNERVVISMPRDLEYFCFVAEIIQEIEKSRT